MRILHFPLLACLVVPGGGSCFSGCRARGTPRACCLSQRRVLGFRRCCLLHGRGDGEFAWGFLPCPRHVRGDCPQHPGGAAPPPLHPAGLVAGSAPFLEPWSRWLLVGRWLCPSQLPSGAGESILLPSSGGLWLPVHSELHNNSSSALPAVLQLPLTAFPKPLWGWGQAAAGRPPASAGRSQHWDQPKQAKPRTLSHPVTVLSL